LPLRNGADTGSYLGEISPAPDNLINRNFQAATPNKKWLTDITEFQIPAGSISELRVSMVVIPRRWRAICSRVSTGPRKRDSSSLRRRSSLWAVPKQASGRSEHSSHSARRVAVWCGCHCTAVSRVNSCNSLKLRASARIKVELGSRGQAKPLRSRDARACQNWSMA
jgi:hypothetical protein